MSAADILTIHDNRPHRLIVVSIDAIEPAEYDQALAYAVQQGGDLPSRVDGLVLWHLAPDKFKQKAPYWLSELDTRDSSSAWHQWFDNGDQHPWHRYDRRCVVVVRREPL